VERISDLGMLAVTKLLVIAKTAANSRDFFHLDDGGDTLSSYKSHMMSHPRKRHSSSDSHTDTVGNNRCYQIPNNYI
jgi:hypothetical protein